jgi:hypothetical protein
MTLIEIEDYKWFIAVDVVTKIQTTQRIAQIVVHPYTP